MLFVLSSCVSSGGENRVDNRVKSEGRTHALSFWEDVLICHSTEEGSITLTADVRSALGWFFAWDVPAISPLAVCQLCDG